MSKPKTIVKRDGRIVEFDAARIENALSRCFAALGQPPGTPLGELTARIVGSIQEERPAVEQVQDVVERTLQGVGEYEAAKAYILYRAEHAKLRTLRPVPDHVRTAFDESAAYFPSLIQQFQFYDKYSRFNYDLGRRETWVETVDRSVNFLAELSDSVLEADVYARIRRAMLSMEASPSMRLLAMAGPAARRNNMAIYNCSYLPVDGLDAFHEALLISMAGCGVGYSVERQFVDKLPTVHTQGGTTWRVVVEDTTEGWAEAVRGGVDAWMVGDDVAFDFSQVRPAGAPLYTKGGRACLTGDTVVYKDRKKSREQNTITIAELYEKAQRTPRRVKLIKIRSLDETSGAFYRNRIVGVVDNGIAPVYKVVTENGYCIKATSNHRFMNDSRRYQFLAQFATGDRIAVNGREVKSANCVDCSTAISRRAVRCKPCHDEFQTQNDDALDTSARQRKTVTEYREAGSECELCGITESENDKRFEVHHVDGNPHNNDHSNLLYLCARCHQQLHATQRVFGDPYSQQYLTFDRITSIQFVGYERVYDLQMEAPNHNFVANGFVSHNSGPGPLKQALSFIRGRILARQGQRLRPIDAHDIMCAVGNAAVSGGVRRTALISLFDNDDDEMSRAKDGDLTGNEQRWNANNSAVWPERHLTQQEIMRFMHGMDAGGRGEPGIFSRLAMNATMPTRRARVAGMGTNPCAEIFLRKYSFCNLSIAVARPDDTYETLKEKVAVATIIGTIQSMATHFPGLRPDWKRNCEEERLLGVDINGQFDSPAARDERVQRFLRVDAKDVNAHYAKLLGINRSAAITCVKPSGNSSQLFDCSPGMHTRWSPYYIRNVRVGTHTPLFKVLRDAGVPMDPENGQTAQDAVTWVVHFPVKAPEGAITRNERTALEQCQYWKQVKLNWTEHNPSVTITYQPDEVLDIAKWVYDNQGIIGGMTFLPSFGAQWDQMPYEEITAEEYERLAAAFPAIDFANVYRHEEEDLTTAAQELACFAGSCEIM